MRKSLLAGAASLGLVLGASLGVVAQTVTGLVCGPPAVGCPLLRLIAGTLAVPAVSSINDPATGVYFPAVGYSSLVSAGVESLRANSSGAFQTRAIAAVSSGTSVTLTAAQMVGGVINRTGVGAAQTDTTDTAANIDTALGAPPVGMSFNYSYVNSTANAVTAAGGSGVTFGGNLTYPTVATKIVTCVKTAATPTYTCI